MCFLQRLTSLTAPLVIICVTQFRETVEFAALSTAKLESLK